MKSNESILTPLIGLKPKDNLTQALSKESALEAMKLAQVEVIKELIKRKWDNTHDFMSGTDAIYKTTDETALELIKEIEHG